MTLGLQSKLIAPFHQENSLARAAPCFLSFFFFLSFLPSLLNAVRLAGSQFSDQGSNLCLLQWKLEVLTTGPPGNSQGFAFNSQHQEEVIPLVKWPNFCSGDKGQKCDCLRTHTHLFLIHPSLLDWPLPLAMESGQGQTQAWARKERYSQRSGFTQRLGWQSWDLEGLGSDVQIQPDLGAWVGLSASQVNGFVWSLQYLIPRKQCISSERFQVTD